MFFIDFLCFSSHFADFESRFSGVLQAGPLDVAQMELSFQRTVSKSSVCTLAARLRKSLPKFGEIQQLGCCKLGPRHPLSGTRIDIIIDVMYICYFVEAIDVTIRYMGIYMIYYICYTKQYAYLMSYNI